MMFGGGPSLSSCCRIDSTGIAGAMGATGITATGRGDGRGGCFNGGDGGGALFTGVATG